MRRITGVGLLLLVMAGTAAGKDLVVDAAGKGDFKTVQAAIDAVPAGNAEPVRIVILAGTYEERLTIPRDRPHITLAGQGKPEATVLTYHLKSSDPRPVPPGATTAPAGTVGTTGSASTTVNANDFTAENLTFANSAGDNVGQAVAIKTNGDRLVFKNCRFLGFQDTLYPAGGGRVYFKDCYITGDTDFIFGNATAVFDRCTINSTDAGYITAANTPAATKIGYVFLDCTLTAPESVRAGSVFLGRPWQWEGNKPSVTFVRTKMGKHIAPAGWHPWDVARNTSPGEHSRYAEFGSMDLEGKPLDVSKRVAWSKQLTAEEAESLTPAKVLAGSDGWNPVAAGGLP
jgi:pectinesterase